MKQDRPGEVNEEQIWSGYLPDAAIKQRADCLRSRRTTGICGSGRGSDRLSESGLFAKFEFS